MDAQNQANPWIPERSLGSVGDALQLAVEAGVIQKVSNASSLHGHRETIW